jgi:phosphohistidine phosphatase
MAIGDLMKTLLILRHAKSSWSDAGLADHERPLNKRGKRDAPRMGRLLREKDLLPDLILSSTAKRAKQTTEAVAEESGYGGDIRYLGEFYAADPETILEVLRSIPDENIRVMVVGHNPGLEELVELITGESAGMPTAALAQILLPLESWQNISEDVEGEIENLWVPRELGEA